MQSSWSKLLLVYVIPNQVYQDTRKVCMMTYFEIEVTYLGL